MSAFANNPWVKKDKALANGEEPEIKKAVRAPRKITKNPFAKEEDESEKIAKPTPKVRFNCKTWI